MATKPTTFNILMFPWLAHGHIFPYLELAKSLLHRKNLHIYFCSTAINFTSIQAFIHQNSLHDSIELVQLHLQPSPELPPHYHTTKNLPPSLNFTLLKALQTSNSSFSEIVATLRPDLVIYDVFQPWAAKIAHSQRIPAVYFSIFGAATLSYVHHQHTFGKKVGFPIGTVRFEDGELKSLEVLFEYLYANIHDVDQDFLFGCFKQSSDVVLIKTSNGIEEKYMEYLSSLSGKKLVPVGPLVSDYIKKDDVEKSEIIRWLDDKKRHSTAFISFGSEYFLSGAEIGEIARGLEMCADVNFVWIIRFPAESNSLLEGTLPEGFLERTRVRGVVVTGWAPQAEILGHPSVGGFVSHCGWSSVTESLHFGVPVVAMPMKLDQPINGRMLSETGGGVEVRRNGEDEVYKGEEIAKGIREVFGEESGERLRRRARELSERMKMEKDGVLDGASEELWRLCLKV
ncbi:beta-d-glucosyl crocetin beta-1 6-glucosyltransferase [Phtheirospermum japonicum]|uniref:Glycosyltransferase n=1 Tax=Phtheirospermum japonicum TaxID=374723 RepID=A0A830BAU9_9LAMI|nr:beta-d-glucosyl crocetin beta-1 6-glucosyltransferase [Phtheirospermum japonicum]